MGSSSIMCWRQRLFRNQWSRFDEAEAARPVKVASRLGKALGTPIHGIVHHPAKEGEGASTGNPELSAGSPPEEGSVAPPGEGLPSQLGKGAEVGAAVTTLISLLTKGELPSAKDLVMSLHPALGIAAASNHDQTVVPIMLWSVGSYLTISRQRSCQSRPSCSSLGPSNCRVSLGDATGCRPRMAAHFLGAKGNLICY
jgi:hypothetical protein